MNKRIVFHGIEKTQPMEDYCNKQLEKVEHFLANERTPIFIDLTLEPSKVHAHHFIELRIKTPQWDKVSSYEGPEFYDVVDRVIDVMYRELRALKDKKKERYREVGRHEEVKKQK
ncbi:MAG TPA: HPF/RaiA family ribosome-associated protein [Candidatus Babeliales bacterium]|jgi:ribosomal subunit interface protein|nr:HPF/RaiA family ribosome-associated protein [Candidatus Babeliales bacterium]